MTSIFQSIKNAGALQAGLSLIEGSYGSGKISNNSVSLDFLITGSSSPKNKTESEKTKFVTEQFESVLVKQFLNDALKPMFKGVLMKTVKGIDCIVTFSQMLCLKVLLKVVGLVFHRSCNSN